MRTRSLEIVCHKNQYIAVGRGLDAMGRARTQQWGTAKGVWWDSRWGVWDASITEPSRRGPTPRGP